MKRLGMENALIPVWHGHSLELAGKLPQGKKIYRKNRVILESSINMTGSLVELSHSDLRLNAGICISLVIQLRGTCVFIKNFP